jgi:phosphoserine phosphatase
MKRIYSAITVFIIGLILILNHSQFLAQNSVSDPLPSWNSGTVKTTIIEFVNRTTTSGNPDYLPPKDRIATFDNDGTLWPEKPLIQGMFILESLKALVKENPDLREKQPFKAALEGDVAYIKQIGEEAVMELLAAVHANQTQENFDAEARQFFDQGIHPTLNIPYTQLAYKPMQELIAYLQKNDFQTWICSGGGIDFVRLISESMYGISPQQVIGSSLKKEFTQKDNQFVLWRTHKLNSFNDKAEKPVNIDLHIGQRPILVAGNVRNGGDIAMLSYSQGGKQKSLQLLINHDDVDREFAYAEADNASLKAAQTNNWQIISMKKDWKRIFADKK